MGGCVRSEDECACYDPPPRRAVGYGHRTEVCVWGEGGCVGGCGCVRSEGECAPRRAAGYGHRTEVCVCGGGGCMGVWVGVGV